MFYVFTKKKFYCLIYKNCGVLVTDIYLKQIQINNIFIGPTCFFIALYSKKYCLHNELSFFVNLKFPTLINVVYICKKHSSQLY